MPSAPTVNLDLNNYVLVGQNINGEYQEVFGQIMDIQPDNGTHWLKINCMVDVQNMELLDVIMNLDSSSLGSIPKLESYSVQEGLTILNHLKDRVASAPQPTVQRPLFESPVAAQAREEAAAVAAAPSPVVDNSETTVDESGAQEEAASPETAPRQGRANIADALDRLRNDLREATPASGNSESFLAVLEALIPGSDNNANAPQRTDGRLLRPAAQQQQVQEPTVVIPPEVQPEPLQAGELKPDQHTPDWEAVGYELNLEGGDMKTILVIAEQSPDSVFAIIDAAIRKNGHIVLEYIDSDTQKNMLDMKIQTLKDFEEVVPEIGSTYILKNGGVQAKVKYLGSNYWLVPTALNTIADLDFQCMYIHPEMCSGFSIEKYLAEDEDELRYFSELEARLNPDHTKYFIDNNTGGKLVFKSIVQPEIITADMLGKKWVDAITYMYMFDAEVNWAEFDPINFHSKEALSRMATFKEDTVLAEMLSEDTPEQVTETDDTPAAEADTSVEAQTD